MFHLAQQRFVTLIGDHLNAKDFQARFDLGFLSQGITSCALA